MTYCVAIKVDQGLVFCSDSRTNAGVDQISTFSKMHTFCGDGERFFVLLSAGNLATTQAVVAKLIWIAAYTATLAQHIKLTFPVAVLESTEAGLAEIIGGVVLVSLASAILHLIAAYRATRPDIKSFIEAKSKR